MYQGSIKGYGKAEHHNGMFDFEGEVEEERPVSGYLKFYDPETKEKKFVV